MHRRTLCLTLSIFLCIIGLISSYAQAGQVQLSWDAPTTSSNGTPLTNLAGYKVYYSQASGNFSSSVNVGKVTTYTLSGLQDGKTYYFVATAYNTAGQESGFSNEVSATLPLPVSINSFTVTPASIVTGNLATLAWTTTGATSVSIAPGGDTNLPVNGSLTVSPSTTTTYTLTATGASGPATKQVTVTVTAPQKPTMASFTATPASIAGGKPSVLAWATSNATAVAITPSGGSNLPTAGSITVTPTATTTYTLTATGAGGTVSRTVTVTVTPPPVANFSASSTSGAAPLRVTFTDTSTGAVSAWSWNFGDGGSSAVQHPVYTYQKAGTYTVSLTVRGPGGSHTATKANLIVVKAPESVKLWLEGEEGQESGLMEVESDEEASAGQYVWVPEGNGTILDPSANDNFVRYTFTVPKADTYIIWGRVSPSATGTGSFFMAVDDAPAESGGSEPSTITEVAPSRYQVAPLQVGTSYYIDRTYTIKALSAELNGQLAIKTANSDKGNTSATFLTFTVTRNATLYVAYDARTTRFPAWLTASFTNTGQRIETTDVPLAVWKREVPAGAVMLPGNQYGSPVGTGSNYLVLVAFHDAGPVPEPDLPMWVWDQAASDTMPIFFLEAGEHTLLIKQRESGTKLDQLLITNDLEYQP